MATKSMNQQNEHEIVECDDCGRHIYQDTAHTETYTCPAVRTVYICRRCVRGLTEIVVTSNSAMHR